MQFFLYFQQINMGFPWKWNGNFGEKNKHGVFEFEIRNSKFGIDSNDLSSRTDKAKLEDQNMH